MIEPAPAGTDSLALTVCLLALDPATGRLRYRGRTGAAIRAALFVELALAGRISGARFPAPAGGEFGRPAWPTGAVARAAPLDSMPDALYTAVTARRPTHWKRWFSHTGADADAALRSLAEAGRLTPGSGRGMRDSRPDLTAAQARRVAELMGAAAQAPSPAALAVVTGAVPVPDAVVALLVTGAGLGGARPRPREALRRMSRLLPLVGAGGGPAALDAATSETVRAAVRHGLTTIRGRAGSRLLSS